MCVCEREGKVRPGRRRRTSDDCILIWLCLSVCLFLPCTALSWILLIYSQSSLEAQELPLPLAPAHLLLLDLFRTVGTSLGFSRQRSESDDARRSGGGGGGYHW